VVGSIEYRKFTVHNKPSASVAAAAANPKSRKSKTDRPLLHHGLVSAVLAVPFSILSSGLLLHWEAGQHDAVKYQFIMWCVIPIWLVVVSSAFMISSRRRCWIYMIALNAIVFAVHYGLK
jgi:ethanolamine transporter EutH